MDDTRTDNQVRRAFEAATSGLRSARSGRRLGLFGSFTCVAVGTFIGPGVVALALAGGAAVGLGSVVFRSKQEKALKKELAALEQNMELRRLCPDRSLRSDTGHSSNFVARKRHCKTL